MLPTREVPDGVLELESAEMEALDGGSGPLQYALFYVAAFKAGFWFGYETVGPALFGD